jgi:hypothetical protein
MEQARRTPPPEPDDDSQIRRTERGVVAGYIHEVSERHTDHPHSDAEPSDEAED